MKIQYPVVEEIFTEYIEAIWANHSGEGLYGYYKTI